MDEISVVETGIKTDAQIDSNSSVGSQGAEGLEDLNKAPKKFSDETREKLHKEGYTIVDIDGQTPTMFELEFMTLGLIEKNQLELIAENWPNGEIALMPGLILAESANKSFQENKKDMLELDDQIRSTIPDVTVKEASIADCLAIIKKLEETKKDNPFEKEIVRTSSIIGTRDGLTRNVVMVNGIMDRWDPQVADPLVHIAPLIKPV